jgi:hypothetical protein
MREAELMCSVTTAWLMGVGMAATALTEEPTKTVVEWPAVDRLPVRTELPNVLETFAGERIADADAWKAKRRPELRALFQHYMYGYLPAARPVTWQAVHDNKNAFGGKVWLREFALNVHGVENHPIHVLVALPANAAKPAPLFLGLSFVGNHMIVDDPKIRIPDVWMYDRHPGVVANRATEAGRGKAKDVWPIETIVERGYGLAVAYNGEWEPDLKTERGVIHAAIPAVGPPDAGWGRIALWAWGLSRMYDAAATLPEIDATRVAVIGHSRLGKTALLAAALDDRFALAIPNQAGCGGTAPSRGKIGESVERINTAFPTWFCGNFKKFNRAPERLPFDQHGLAALCAPRPVLFSNAEEDSWANPAGQFDVLVAADPAYRLFGVEGVADRRPPALNVLSQGRLSYFIRPGMHAMTPVDWQAYLEFADRHLQR